VTIHLAGELERAFVQVAAFNGDADAAAGDDEVRRVRAAPCADAFARALSLQRAQELRGRRALRFEQCTRAITHDAFVHRHIALLHIGHREFVLDAETVLGINRCPTCDRAPCSGAERFLMAGGEIGLRPRLARGLGVKRVCVCERRRSLDEGGEFNIAAVRAKAKELALLIDETLPTAAGREKATAITKCEEAMMWACAGIARHSAT